MDINTELRKVKYGEITIEYLLTRKQVKNINIRIKSDGKIYISAGSKVSLKRIDEIIKSKQSFIMNALEKFEKAPKDIDSPKLYIDGEHFNILGKSVPLKIDECKEESVTTDGVIILLKVKDKENQKRKENLINNWLKQMQAETFNQISQEIYPIFEKYNVEFPTIKIKTMKSQWGSCQLSKGIITLNSKLIEYPKSCIEYVILHEFAHFIHPNHSKQFHNFVTTLMPDWKERKKKLEKRN